jgi:hypothetical protein
MLLALARSERKRRREDSVKAIIKVFILAALATPNLVSALERDFYLGASLGEKVTLDIEEENWPGTETDDRSFKLLAGVDIGDYLAVELAYLDLGTHSCCSSVVADWGYVIDVDGYTVSLLGKLPIERFELFARVGYGFWDQSGFVVTIGGQQPFSEHPKDFVAGAGADFNLNDHFAVRAEWEYFKLESGEWHALDDAGDSFFIGLQYEF